MQKNEEVDKIYYQESHGLLFFSRIKVEKAGRSWLIHHQFGSVVDDTIHVIGDEIKTFTKVKEMRLIFLALEEQYSRLNYILWENNGADNVTIAPKIALLQSALLS